MAIGVEFSNGQVFGKVLADGKSFDDSGVTYIAQGELERYIDEQSDLNQYIHRVVFESPTVRDSSDVFEYESLVQKTASLQVQLDAENVAIDRLEHATTRAAEEELIRLGKKTTAAIQDADARIAIAAKKLSAETRKQNSDEQEVVARLKAEKADLGTFVEILRENTSRLAARGTRLSAA